MTASRGAAGVSLLAVMACGGGGSDARPRVTSACGLFPDAAVATAVTEYIKLARPTPQRFLFAATTDSGLPDPAVVALQNKGPTYFYPPDTAQRRKVRELLSSVGGYATLLVVRRPAPNPVDSQAVVRLGGHYVGGDQDGIEAPSRSLHFTCSAQTRQWRFTRAEEERQS